MEIKNLAYLFLLLVFIIIPVILSFQKKVRFAYRLRYILPAVIFSGAIFGMWNMRFTELQIWNFNSEYLIGIDLLNIPIEEWISFIIIPVSSIYIYEWLKVKYESFEKANFFVAFSLIFFILTGILAYSFRRNMFSFFTFFLTAIYLGYTVFRNRFKKKYTKFYLTFFISLIPFLIISAVMNMLPIIVYNSSHIMGIGLLGFPVEKIGYLFLMLLINITIYEYFSERQYY